MDTMNAEVLKLWPELEWIVNEDLRQKTAQTWERALEKSVLSSGDLNRIPFTLLCGPGLKVTFMQHKRAVVHIARESGNKMNEFFGNELPVDMDVLIAGAILADVGKLLEYELDEKALTETQTMVEASMAQFRGLLLEPQTNLAELRRFPMIDDLTVCHRCNFRELCGRD